MNAKVLPYFQQIWSNWSVLVPNFLPKDTTERRSLGELQSILRSIFEQNNPYNSFLVTHQNVAITSINTELKRFSCQPVTNTLEGNFMVSLFRQKELFSLKFVIQSPDIFIQSSI